MNDSDQKTEPLEEQQHARLGGEGAPDPSAPLHLRTARSAAIDVLMKSGVRYGVAAPDIVLVPEPEPVTEPVARVRLVNAARGLARAEHAIADFITRRTLDQHAYTEHPELFGTCAVRALADLLSKERSNRWIDIQVIARLHWACDEIDYLRAELSRATKSRRTATKHRLPK